MFGFGMWEIAILIGLLVLLFGARRAGVILRRGIDLHGKVSEARSSMRSVFSLESLLGRGRNKKP